MLVAWMKGPGRVRSLQKESGCILLGNQLPCETRAVELLLDQVGSQGVRTCVLRQGQSQQLPLSPAHLGPRKLFTQPRSVYECGPTSGAVHRRYFRAAHLTVFHAMF